MRGFGRSRLAKPLTDLCISSRMKLLNQGCGWLTMGPITARSCSHRLRSLFCQTCYVVRLAATSYWQIRRPTVTPVMDVTAILDAIMFSTSNRKAIESQQDNEKEEEDVLKQCRMHACVVMWLNARL